MTNSKPSAVITIILFMAVVSIPIMMVDYFANGCIVDYDNSYTKEIKPGVYKHFRGSTCRQIIIHTERGEKMKGRHP